MLLISEKLVNAIISVALETGMDLSAVVCTLRHTYHILYYSETYLHIKETSNILFRTLISVPY